MYQKSNDSKNNSNSRLNEAALSPLGGNSPQSKEETCSQNVNLFPTGRISPPEKRFSLSTHNILEHCESSKTVLLDNNSLGFKKQSPYMCNLSPEQQNLNMIVSHLLNNPSLITKELRRQFSNNKSQMISSSDTLIDRTSRESSASPGILSEAASPSQSSTSPISSANVLGNTNLINLFTNN